MRIAVNTRLLLPQRLDGIGWFTCETLRRMVAAHPDDEFYFFFDRRPSMEFIFGRNVHPVVLCPQARHPVLWYLFFEWSVRRKLDEIHADVFLSPDGMIPLHSSVPSLAVIHDLNFEHASGNLKRSHQWYMTHFFPRFAKKAARLATVSEYSRRDIADTYHIDVDKIDVVYNGSHHNYRPHSEAQNAVVRQRFTQGCPYIIFVSTILKRKNLANLLLAFDKVKEDDNSGLKLVVVGSKVWWKDELAAAYDNMHHRDDVIMMGRADSELLSLLMSAAEMLVYPSYFEGFGIPILEAMYAEVPVIASSTTSMPEVGGDAVLYVDPYSPDDIAAKIARLRDPHLRADLVSWGREQRKRYSWDRTAGLLWQSLMNTVEAR